VKRSKKTYETPDIARSSAGAKISVFLVAAVLMINVASESNARVDGTGVGSGKVSLRSIKPLSNVPDSSGPELVNLPLPATTTTAGSIPATFDEFSGPLELRAPNEQRLASRPARSLKRESPTRKRDIARKNGVSAERLEATLDDETAEIDSNDRIFFVDPPHDEVPAPATIEIDPANNSPLGEPEAISFTDAFALHSKPGSTKTLYLDFDGATTAGTYWNQRVGIPSRTTPAYDADGNPNQFTAAELANIEGIWDAVREDFVPFDVDVTTQQPTYAQLNRSAASDTIYGITVVITGDNWQCPSTCSGISYVNSFGTGDDAAKPSWAFYTPVYATFLDSIAGTVSHEAGHAFGLSHDGTSTSSYYAGHGVWQPIMGAGPYNRHPVSQWSKGEYLGANNFEDDIAIIAQTSPVVPDDNPGTVVLPPGLSTYSLSGAIERSTDIDTFRVQVGPTNRLNINISPGSAARDLDVRLEIRNASGTLVKQQSSSSVGTIWSYGPMPAGTYDVSILSAGYGDPLTTGFSTYGSVGRYKLRMIFLTQPGPPSNVIATLGNRSVTVTWNRPVDDGGEITGYIATACPPGGGALCSRVDTTLQGATFNNLTAGVIYQLYVWAINSYAQGQQNPPIPVPIVGVPLPPNISRNLSGQSVVGYNWGSGGLNGSPLLGYELSVTDLTTALETVRSFDATSSGANFGSAGALGDLPANTSTMVKIRALSGVGPSDWSVPQIVNYGRAQAAQVQGVSAPPRQPASGGSSVNTPRP
jgi:hypothetical protein